MNGKLIFQRKTFFVIYLFLFNCWPLINQAQSVKRECISSYGIIVTNENATFGQTVGQPYNTKAFYENETSILQGFQQPIVFKIENIDIKDTKKLNITVYPNPANYFITIQSKEIIEKSVILVTDLNGKLIFSEQVTQLLTYNLNCETWKNSTYIITISDINQNKSSLKLIINK